MTHAMGIGLFDNAEGIAIDSGVERVCTSGYHSTGVGAAWYTYQPSFDLATYPRAGFTAADSRIFALDRVDQEVTPFMFGTVGGGSDDVVPLRAFFDYCENHVVYRAMLSGSFAIGSTLRIGKTANLTPSTRIYHGGNFSLAPTEEADPMDHLIYMHYMKDCRFGGRWLLRGSPASETGQQYHDRLVTGVGIYMDDCRGAHFNALFLERFWYAGIQVDRATNSSMCTIDKAIIYYIGSGGIGDTGENPTVQSLVATFSGATPSGLASDVGQRTTITVPTNKLPPADILAVAGATSVQSLPILVRINARPYRVTGINWSTGAVSLYPWLDSAAGTSGTLEWIWGGAVGLHGNDCNCWQINQLEMKYVGVGLVAACGQGPTVNSFVIQNDSGIGLLVGEQTDTYNCGNGTDIRGFYMEDVEEHYVNLTDFESSENSGTISSEYTLDIGRMFALSAPRAADNSLTAPIKQWKFWSSSDLLMFKDGPDWADVEVGGNQDLIVARSNGRIVTLQNDTRKARLFNYRAQTFCFFGTGPNGAPTGTVTFQLHNNSSTRQLNGVVDGTFSASGFDGPAIFSVYQDTAGNYFVAVAGGKAGIGGSKTWDPPSVAAGAATSTTLTVQGAQLGDSVLVGFNKALQGMQLTGSVSAADTVEAVLSNPTAAAINLVSGTLSARIAR
ncbi:MAG TPA: hypothetical protein VN231_14915 [Allosphingosinicella sp.]|nr:hypothetical protein [Allosphingosinicella sp.]